MLIESPTIMRRKRKAEQKSFGRSDELTPTIKVGNSFIIIHIYK